MHMNPKTLLTSLIFKNILKKSVSLLFAIFIWFLVSQTITITKTIPNVAVRITGLQPEQTVVGLLSNGLLKKRITLTITGNKSAIQDLRTSDIEILINANGHRDSWIESISKQNIISLNPDVDIKKHIKGIVATDLFINLTKFITEDVTVTVMPPTGSAPKGYEYLDIWPKYLIQKVSGPQEQVLAIKEQGLELYINLNKVSAEELNQIYLSQDFMDEITFKIPDSWKKISIPFGDDILVNLNDPRSDLLRLSFLKQEFLPLDLRIPIMLFFPIKYSNVMNPQEYSIENTEVITYKNGIYQLDLPLYVRDVSRLFLDVVKNNITVAVVMSPSGLQDVQANWAVEFIDERSLEDTFVQAALEQESFDYESIGTMDEQLIRHRFRDYLRKLTLLNDSGVPLTLSATIHDKTVTIKEEKPKLLK